MSIWSSVYQGELADHLPMTLVALEALGAEKAARRAYAERYSARLEPLGDAEKAARAAIVQEIAREGRSTVIARRVRHGVDSVGSLAFHSLIRLAYAIDRADDDEAAAALAAWELYPLALVPAAKLSAPASSSKPSSPHDAFVALAKAVAPVQRVRGTLITDAMLAMAAKPGFAEAIAAYVPSIDDLPRLARTSAGIFAVSRAFTALHMMTGLHALRIVLPALDAQDRLSIFHAAWIALGASFLTLGEVAVPDDAAIDALVSSAPAGALELDALFALARAQDDEHVIKAIYTATKEEAAYGDRIFRYAAWSYAKSLAA